jgi:alpha-glucosidase (family GH31 glycosyl hydrolase)
VLGYHQSRWNYYS